MLKGELKKKKILETAEKLFFEKGYSGSTVDDLLGILQCSKGSLYHHFESKQQILTAICLNKVADAFAAYREEDTNQALHAVNRLLYYALPVRKGQEKFIATLLPLMGTVDGDIVSDTFAQAEEQLFCPEFKKLLKELQEKQQAFYNLEALPDMLFGTYNHCLKAILTAGGESDPGQLPSVISDLLQAVRFMFERCLDLPYGSMDMVPLDEILYTLNHARLLNSSEQPRQE